MGEDSLLYPNVTLMAGTVVGDRVTLHAGVVLGSDGFGFALAQVGREKFPQIGCVVVEDDVEIGANSTVDRAALDETRIGAGTKIDNLVQIGHNVTIGKHCTIVAQVGIAGSVKLGDNVTPGRTGGDRRPPDHRRRGDLGSQVRRGQGRSGRGGHGGAAGHG